MGLSVLEMILDLQVEFYKKYKKAVNILFINKYQYTYLMRDLEVNQLDNLHGMKIIIHNQRKIELM
jgi:hypothetical protein